MEPNEANRLGELLHAPLEIDEEELRDMASERGAALDLSDNLRLLACRNELEVRKTFARRRRASGGRGWQSEAELRICAAPHEACRFVSASLLVDIFSYSPGAEVQSLVPEREGAQAVEITETVAPALKVAVPGTSVEASLGGSVGKKYTVTTPEVIGVAIGKGARWTFQAPSEHHELRLDQPLRLVVDFPENLDALRAGLTVRARVAFRGFPGIVPLIGRHSASKEGLIRLDG